MKESGVVQATPNGGTKSPPRVRKHSSNGSVVTGDLNELLSALQTMRDGDFSVRLPGNWTGLAGKIADTFNDIVAANQQMAQELKRVGQLVGKEGKTRERTRFHQTHGAWGGDRSLRQHACGGSAPTDHRSYAGDCGSRAGQSDTNRANGCGRETSRGRVFAFGQHCQHHDSTVGRVHGRSHPCGPRSWYGRQARRPGSGVQAWRAPGRT